jgi:hypothetical protein
MTLLVQTAVAPTRFRVTTDCPSEVPSTVTLLIVGLEPFVTVTVMSTVPLRNAFVEGVA